MVSTRTPKTAKASYAERVLGAFSQVQKDHRKHAIHQQLCVLKKTAQAKKDKLGPRWTHWVGKAVSKLEDEGIFEPANPTGSVALTPNGKKRGINDARRSLKLSIGASPGHNDEGLIWKHVIGYAGSKRSRRESTSNEDVSYYSENENTPSKVGSAKKRARLSTASPKKAISRMTKSELKAELDSLKKARAQELRRETSPLTELDSEDEVITTHLREEIRERDEEIENMRRELAAARQKNNDRFATPRTNLNFDRPSSPLAANASFRSRNYAGGVMRTESGSYIPNLSKRPTPAPSSPERDMESDERNSVAENVDMFLDTESHEDEGTHLDASRTRAMQDGGLNLSRLGPSALNFPQSTPDVLSREQFQPELERDAIVTSLKSEISDLKARVAEDAVLLSSKTAATASLENIMSNRIQALESLVADRDATIGALRKENARFQTDVAGLQETWKRAEEMATGRLEELQASESLVVELRALREGGSRRIELLENSNGDLIRKAKESLQTKCTAITNELRVLRQREQEMKSRIDGLTESLSEASNDAREVEEKQLASERLEDNLKEKERRVTQVLAQLVSAENSAGEISARLTVAEAAITSLNEELTLSQKEVESVKLALTKTTHELRSEESQRQRAGEEAANREQELRIAQDAKANALASEVAANEVIIKRLSDEKRTIQGRLSAAEASIVESKDKHQSDRMHMSRNILELEASLESARGDIDRLNTRLVETQTHTEKIHLDLEKRKVDLENLQAFLDVERKDKSAVEADLAAYVGKAQELEEELLDFKKSKRRDDATISNLRDSFSNLRESQSKLFEEFGAKVGSYFLHQTF
ncbi:hypothetical protein BDZ97DRAFT_1827975 [Flammula alnicola]|nr:hypothetical protein BDZ97DRAFT_1827975 [Flammula alnicola]